MSLSDSSAYAVVIGGGFYGANIALFLAEQQKGKVFLLEKESSLLSRASYYNQARVHRGYHYLRSFTTAYRSSINFPRFIKDWPDAIKKDFIKIYAIARYNSKITAKQFTRYCKEIGAKIEPAESFSHIFNDRMIEQAFAVQEYAFNATVLAEWAKSQLELKGIEILLNSTVTKITKNQPSLEVNYKYKDFIQKIRAEIVFNCTYSGLNQFGGDFSGTQSKLKHEVAEIALMDMPDSLKNIGVTVMDGPFFSIMPFPNRRLHTLSHVRYTPHFNWLDEKSINPYEKLELYERQTQVDRMVRDAQRYIPDISKAQYCDSFFEIKTIVDKNEINDGRPILFEECVNIKGLYSVLGGKIDNIYDILERLKRW